MSNGKDGTEYNRSCHILSHKSNRVITLYRSNPDVDWKMVAQTSDVGYNSTDMPLALEFNDSCLGSFIRCYNGLTIGVWIRVSDRTFSFVDFQLE